MEVVFQEQEKCSVIRHKPTFKDEVRKERCHTPVGVLVSNLIVADDRHPRRGFDGYKPKLREDFGNSWTQG